MFIPKTKSENRIGHQGTDFLILLHNFFPRIWYFGYDVYFDVYPTFF